MRRWLLAAGVYNLIWGAAVVLMPKTTLSLLGVTPESDELWPQLWACVGMIVGVYGVGYLVAAQNPLRHWPIVLVGLLGKIFGPIGFIDAAIRGTLPWTMGGTIIFNDLLWWPAFAGILWAAVRASMPAPSDEPISLDEALGESVDHTGRTLRSMTDERATLVLLLRHSGCTFCKEALADLSGWQDRIRGEGLGIAVVGMTPSSDDLRSVGEGYGVKDVAWVADPDRKLYRALEVGRGSFLQLFGPLVWLRGIAAGMRGHGVGRLEGDGFQMPGAFVIEGGRVLKAYRHTTAADRPDLAEMACSIS